MKKPAEAPALSIRMLFAGTLSLFLLVWVVFVPDTVPGLIIPPGYEPRVIRIMTTVLICAILIVLLVGTAVRGNPGQRAASALALFLPLAILLWTALKFLT